MSFFKKLKGEFIDIIEFLDNTQNTIVHRFERHNNEIKNNAKLVVREGQIGGDRQRILSCKTQYNDIKFKLILLPVYMSSYMYGNKLYHFYVNGRTGKITGDRPYSVVKIVLAVIAALLAIAGIYLWAEGA